MRAHQRERLVDSICVRSDPLCAVYAKENDKWKEVGRTEIIWVSPSAMFACVRVLRVRVRVLRAVCFFFFFF
jgi:hypothetical protein